jgi:SAM-dependent methyltransferase
MSAEFDTIAEWTAQVAIDLGESFRIPAACRGSGSPAALDWLIERLGVTAGDALLDCGAGVGGPAAYAAQRRAIRPTLVEPEAGACRAARALFGHPVVQASAAELPVDDESFDAAWSLGVLCTMPDQLALLTELRRVVRPAGRIGLLVFMARTSKPFEAPAGNDFPTESKLLSLIEDAHLRVEARRGTEGLPPAPQEWQNRVQTVSDELTRRHAGTRAWQLADEQGELIGRLLGDHTVTGELLILRRDR